MTEQEKIDAGILFFPGDPELKAKKLKAHNLNMDYNKLYEGEKEARQAILKDLLGEIGEGTFLQGPITFHYGCHTFIGDDVFINFNFTVQDDATVTIGDGCNFGPNVTIVTPVHPMIASERKALKTAAGEPRRLCWAKPVTVGKRCWICANASPFFNRICGTAFTTPRSTACASNCCRTAWWSTRSPKSSASGNSRWIRTKGSFSMADRSRCTA